jgi:hypothetical protein
MGEILSLKSQCSLQNPANGRLLSLKFRSRPIPGGATNINHTPTNYIYLKLPGQDESTGMFKYSVRPPEKKKNEDTTPLPPPYIPLFSQRSCTKHEGRLCGLKYAEIRLRAEEWHSLSEYI